MGRLKSSEKASRTLTAQSMQLVDENGLADLLTFVNLDPATVTWKGWDDVAGWHVYGEPCRDAGAEDQWWRLRELHSVVRTMLADILQGTFTLSGPEPISVSYTYNPNEGVKVSLPQRELHEYFMWTILHLLASERRGLLYRCERPECFQFFMRKTIRSNHCSLNCRTMDRPRRRKTANRVHAKASRRRNSSVSLGAATRLMTWKQVGKEIGVHSRHGIDLAVKRRVIPEPNTDRPMRWLRSDLMRHFQLRA